MAKIRLIRGGCGVPVKTGASTRYVLKTPASGPFECPDAMAARLVKAGAAEPVGTSDAADPGADPNVSPFVHSKKSLEMMDYNELRRLAEKTMGLKLTSKGKKAIIDAIMEEQMKGIPETADMGDDAPELQTADPFAG